MAIVAWMGLAAAGAGCASRRPLISDPYGDEPRPIVRRISIQSYTTRDGVFHRFAGTIEPAGDSLRLVSAGQTGRGALADRPRVDHWVARDSVTVVTETHPWAGIVIVAGVAAIAYLAVIAAAFRSVYWQ